MINEQGLTRMTDHTGSSHSTHLIDVEFLRRFFSLEGFVGRGLNMHVVTPPLLPDRGLIFVLVAPRAGAHFHAQHRSAHYVVAANTSYFLPLNE